MINSDRFAAPRWEDYDEPPGYEPEVTDLDLEEEDLRYEEWRDNRTECA